MGNSLFQRILQVRNFLFRVHSVGRNIIGQERICSFLIRTEVFFCWTIAVCVSTVHEQQGTFPQNGQKRRGRGQNRKDHWLQMAIGWSVGPYRHYLNLPQNRTWRERKKGENTCFPAKGVFFAPPHYTCRFPFPPFLKPCMTLFPQQKKAFFRGRRGYSAFFLGGGRREEEGGGD